MVDVDDESIKETIDSLVIDYDGCQKCFSGSGFISGDINFCSSEYACSNEWYVVNCIGNCVRVS